MSLHYACFLFFFGATIAFFIADFISPPPQNFKIHYVTEIVKIISSVTLQLSLSIVLYMLIN